MELTYLDEEEIEALSADELYDLSVENVIRCFETLGVALREDQKASDCEFCGHELFEVGLLVSGERLAPLQACELCAEMIGERIASCS